MGGARTKRFGPPPISHKLMIESVVDLNEVVVLILVAVFFIVIGVVEIIVVILGVIENVERQFDAQLSEKNVVVGEERVAQRKLSCFERGVVGLVSIAGDVEVVFESVEQARQRAAGISSHDSHSTVRRRTLSGEVELRTNNRHHQVGSLDLGGLLRAENASLPVRIKQLRRTHVWAEG